MNRMPSLLVAVCFSMLMQFPFVGDAGADETSSLKLAWHVDVGFAPFEGLTDSAATNRTWLPIAPDTLEPESLTDWYARVVQSTPGDQLHSPYAEYADKKRPGPWVDRAGPNDYADRSTASPWISVDSAEPDQCRAECYRASYVHPTTTKISISLQEGASDSECTWRLRLPDQTEKLVARSKCNQPVIMSVPLLKKKSQDTRMSTICVTTELGTSGCTTINPSQLVVLAFGDSFAAGEGNPDIPTTWPSKALALTSPDPTYDWLKHPLYPAKWLDNRCHRSFWNHQSYEAMHLAVTNPHRLVTFLSYSCSGAAILDGMLVPQWAPPGESLSFCEAIDARTHDRRCRVAHSQLMAAVSDLCSKRVVNPYADPRVPLQPSLYALRKSAFAVAKSFSSSEVYLADSYKWYSPSLDMTSSDGDPDDAHLDIGVCPRDSMTQPDVILLSIGGNDIGFGPLIHWGLVPNHGKNDFGGRVEEIFLNYAVRRPTVVCPAWSIGSDIPDTNQKGCLRYDKQLLDSLPSRYALLLQAMRAVNLPTDRLVVTSYPDPLRKEKVAPSKLCSDGPAAPDRNDIVQHGNSWDVLHSELPGILEVVSLGIADRYNMPLNLTDENVSRIMATTLTRLRSTMRAIASENTFLLADGVADSFVGHAYCQSDVSELPGSLPSTPGITWGSGLCSHNPACWKPFAPRQRFVRTANDSAMIQTSDRSDSMSGTVHPSAEGQAAMADALSSVVDCLGLTPSGKTVCTTATQ